MSERWPSLLSTLLYAGALLAQQSNAISATTKSPSASEPKYQDKIIPGLSQGESDSSANNEYNENSVGWPRYARIEARAGNSFFDESKINSGLVFSGLLDTPNHGVLSADINYSAPNRSTGTLRQRGMPMEGGWLANTDIGITATPLPTLLRLPSRAYVPGNLIEGLSSNWINNNRGLQFLVASGRPGSHLGHPVDWFRARPGTINSLGAQASIGSWQIASRLANGRGLATDLSDTPGSAFDAEASQLSLRHTGNTFVSQGNFIQTHLSDDGPQRRGFWLDSDWNTGALTNTAGIYRFDPNLNWVGQMLASNLEGAYARTTWTTRRWSADGSIDVLRPITKPSDFGVYSSANVRWRQSKDLTWGSGGYFRKFDDQAWSLYINSRWRNDFGFSGARLSESIDLDSVRRELLTLDHSWSFPSSDVFLSATVTAGRESGTTTTNRYDWGLSFGFSLRHDILLRGNVFTNALGSGDASSGSNLSLNWNLSPSWSLDFTYNTNQYQRQSSTSIDPLSIPISNQSVTENRNLFFLALRYEERGGSKIIPLGGNPTEGGGMIEGSVFLDTNRDGIQEANEIGALGVTVVLDGRYITRTDTAGRFSFPLVTPGKHHLNISNETLPLPWIAAEDGGISAEVRVRDRTQVNIGTVKQRNQ